MFPSMWTSYLIEWLPHEMVVTMSDHGWWTLELGEEHGHDLLKLGPPTREGETFRRFAADHGVRFLQGHFCMSNKGLRPEDREGRSSIDIAPPDDREFVEVGDYVRRWVDLFGALGIEAGVLHVGGAKLRQAGWDPERIFHRRVEAVQRVAAAAAGGPTTICLENLGPDAASGTAEGLRRIVEATGMPNVAICLDTGHANMSGVDNAAFVREAGPLLCALHIADNLGTNDDHMLPHGRGTVVWPPVMRALREVGYRGLFNLEVPGENRCPKAVRLAKLDYALELATWMISCEGVQST